MLKKTTFLIFLISCIYDVSAQLSFPKGKVLNLFTHSTPLYIETEILFKTGIYKITDYTYTKVSDSLDKRWIVSSCMNGECLDSLPKSGNFIPDFGMNDSTGFIRFHVESNDSDGKSVIVYEVANKKNMLDAATLTFNITYKNNAAIAEVDWNLPINIYPNPTNEKLIISYHFDPSKNNEIGIYDIRGKVIYRCNATADLTIIDLKNECIDAGTYFVKISDGEKTAYSKFSVY